MSATEAPQVAESRDDTIIRVIGFARKNHYQCEPFLADYNRRHDNLLNPTLIDIPTSITSDIPRDAPVPVSGMGSLDTMPRELFFAICSHLDVKSYLKLRQACRSSRMLTSGYFKFRHVVEDATNTFVGMVRTGMWGHITLTELYEALCNPNCQVCGQLGHFLYLPTPARVCIQCLHSTATFRTVTLPSFSRKAKRSKAVVEKSVPVVKGSFGKRPNGLPRSIMLVNLAEAIRLMNTAPDIEVGDGMSSLNTDRQYFARNMATVPLPLLVKGTNAMESFETLSCKGCARLYSQTVVGNHAMPIVIPLKALADRHYLKAGLIEHLNTCRPARALWRASQGGVASITHLDTVYIETGGLSFHKIDYARLDQDSQLFRRIFDVPRRDTILGTHA